MISDTDAFSSDLLGTLSFLSPAVLGFSCQARLLVKDGDGNYAECCTDYEGTVAFKGSSMYSVECSRARFGHEEE